MRRLSREQEQMLAEYDRDMAAIRRDREQAASSSKIPVSPSRRPASPPPPRRVSLAAVVKRVGYADGRPHRVCRICFEPAHLVARTGMCTSCAAEVRWRVSLARQGLKVVS